MANSLAHTKWNCKYHIVFIPKYRRKIIYNKLRADIQGYIRDLCKWKGGRNNRRTYDARLCAFAIINTTQTKYIEFHGILKRKKCNDDISKTWEFKV